MVKEIIRLKLDELQEELEQKVADRMKHGRGPDPPSLTELVRQGGKTGIRLTMTCLSLCKTGGNCVTLHESGLLILGLSFFPLILDVLCLWLPIEELDRTKEGKVWNWAHVAQVYRQET